MKAAIFVRQAIHWLIAIAILQSAPVSAQSSSAFEIIEQADHSTDYFTQGLEIHAGTMFESGGLYGKSKLRKYRPGTDDTLLEVPIAERFFAEGLTVFDNELFLLTWQENTLLVFDPQTLTKKREHSYKGEGWGLTSNTTRLIMSNGTDTLYFRNPDTFNVERTVRVHINQRSVSQLNELEYAQGYVWANVWQTPFILKIKPDNGEVVAFYDFTELLMRHANGDANRVLNGIAYDAERQGYWITGKKWSAQYLVRFD